MGSASPMMPGSSNLVGAGAGAGAGAAGHHGAGDEKALLEGVGAGLAGGAIAGGHHHHARGASDEKSALLGGVGAGAASGGATRHPSSSAHGAQHHDNASMLSASDTTTSQGMLSGADAAIVADAFRQAMRKPDFSGRPVEEDESPDTNERASGELAVPSAAVLSEELRAEGRDIRSVGSARGVRVHGNEEP